MVLCRVFWLQSMKTFPGRTALAMSAVTRAGSRRCQQLGDSQRKVPGLVVGVRAVQRDVELQSLGAGRLGPSLQVDRGEHLADLQGHLAALGHGGRLAGIEIEDDERRRIGIRSPCHGCVQLERSEVGGPYDGGHRVQHAVADRPTPVAGAERRRYPIGPMLGAALLEEALPVDAVGKAPQREPPVAEVRQQDGRDAGVVVDDLGLGEPDVGIEDLVQVRDAECAALDLDQRHGGEASRAAVEAWPAHPTTADETGATTVRRSLQWLGTRRARCAGPARRPPRSPRHRRAP